MEKWINTLNDEDLIFIRKIIESNFKLKSYQEQTGESYFATKKKIDDIRERVDQGNRKSEFKEYLDFLVYEDALMSSIAEVIYKKHLREIGDVE